MAEKKKGYGGGMEGMKTIEEGEGSHELSNIAMKEKIKEKE